ncbi:L-rhamnose-binding lectin SML isoform X1 [Gadus morhua]|uniref:L-rhamnose-binding lectin SML isoform X1 n=1 Tax=Gadus morhua TaxID=8049 RepID=UPI0011B58253|nr:L-rhamnose-binding lectin SML-like isoform X1 [Gadus morhua]
MLSSLLRSALVLAAVCFLTSAESVITCENRMQRLSCDHGVVSVLTVAYGRTNRRTCSEGRPPGQLENTECSQTSALEALANRCNGKKVCEVDKEIFSDPCPETYKYIQTTYTCLPAHHVVACEDSEVELFCDGGQTIALIGAFYGRADRTTCIQGVPDGQFNNITCSTPTANQVVTERCNGKSRCSVYAVNSVFQDACYGTTKYLELAYSCEYPL